LVMIKFNADSMRQRCKLMQKMGMICHQAGL
jgi:hypothetical protein